MSAARGGTVALEGIVHALGTTRVIDDVSSSVKAGEMVALLGPSGCGTSTLLRLLAGLQRRNGGRVRIDGCTMDKFVPRERDVSIVFQSYALFPRVSVLDNVA